MNDYSLNITENEAVVLFDFSHRFDTSDKLEFTHPAEYIALMKIAGQVNRTSPAFFDQEHESLVSPKETPIIVTWVAAIGTFRTPSYTGDYLEK